MFKYQHDGNIVLNGLNLNIECGTKIGIIGLITPFLSDGLLPENHQWVEVSDLLSSLNTQIEKIRNNVDLIFVLSHLGIPYDREDEYKSFISYIEQGETHPIRNALELAHYTDDVDVIITGGVSKGYNTPWVDPNTHLLLQISLGHHKLKHYKYNPECLKVTISWQVNFPQKIQYYL